MLAFSIGLVLNWLNWSFKKTLAVGLILGFYVGLLLIVLANIGLGLLLGFSLVGLFLGTIAGLTLSLLAIVIVMSEMVFGYCIGYLAKEMLKKIKR